MASASVNVASIGTARTAPADPVVLTVRPDMRVVKVSLFATLTVLAVGLAGCFLRLQVDRELQTGLSVLIVAVSFGSVVFVLAMYEALSKAVYTLTAEYIEEECGIIYKRLRRIPLSYVRDVTQTQNPLQAVFGISSITVSPTNGDRIVLSNIKNGKEARETIWQSVLLKAVH